MEHPDPNAKMVFAIWHVTPSPGKCDRCKNDANFAAFSSGKDEYLCTWHAQRSSYRYALTLERSHTLG